MSHVRRCLTWLFFYEYIKPMGFLSGLERYYLDAKGNRWFNYFTTFNRIALALGFLPAGFVKIRGERFTSLSNNQPMGHYLEALHHTGFYYPFLGILQVTAAVLLLVPRTAVLGALLYFPIILNIWVLSVAVRFEGSLVSSSLMILANLYLLAWNYDKLKFILPFASPSVPTYPATSKLLNNKFPGAFFSCCFAGVAGLALLMLNIFDIEPRNTLPECMTQCKNSEDPNACKIFCEGIHLNGKPLDESLEEYNQAVRSKDQKK